MIAKENQPNLFNSLDAINWRDIPVSHRVEERGHGRHEVRTIQLTDAPPGLRFQHMSQAFLVERSTIRPERKNGRTTRVETAVAVLGVTTMTPTNSTPEHVATHIRDHWGIENKSHSVSNETVSRKLVFAPYTVVSVLSHVMAIVSSSRSAAARVIPSWPAGLTILSVPFDRELPD